MQRGRKGGDSIESLKAVHVTLKNHKQYTHEDVDYWTLSIDELCVCTKGGAGFFTYKLEDVLCVDILVSFYNFDKGGEA